MQPADLERTETGAADEFSDFCTGLFSAGDKDVQRLPVGRSRRQRAGEDGVKDLDHFGAGDQPRDLVRWMGYKSKLELIQFSVVEVSSACGMIAL